MWWMLSVALASPFAQVTEEGSTLGLELAARTYRHEDGSVVLLAGVAHVADAAFYAAVQEQLSAAEVVLYEGVGGDRSAGSPPADPELHQAYRALASGLGLAFQLDVLDYTQAGWRNSDLSVAELEQVAGDRGDAAMVGRLLEGGREIKKMEKLGNKAAKRETVKAIARVMLIESLPRAESAMSAVLGADLYHTLVVARNDKVYADLQAEKGKVVGVLYGAGHLQDLEGRLLGAGYTPHNSVWIPTITVDPEASGVPPVLVSAVRKKVAKKLDKLAAKGG